MRAVELLLILYILYRRRILSPGHYAVGFGRGVYADREQHCQLHIDVDQEEQTVSVVYI